jgi:hypothetical protein
MTINRNEADSVVEQLLEEERPEPKPIEKKAETQKPKQKQYFDIKAEVMLPATLTYRVFAFDEEDALKEMMKRPPNDLKPKLAAKKLLKATVYQAGTTLIKAIKNFNR